MVMFDIWLLTFDSKLSVNPEVIEMTSFSCGPEQLEVLEKS